MDGTKPWFKDVLKVAHSEKAPGVRAAVRFPLNLPVTVHLEDETVEARTENVSASGIALLTAREMNPGERIRFLLNMPGEAMGVAKDVHISCQGRVVRCQAKEEEFLVAATIDNYSFFES